MSDTQPPEPTLVDRVNETTGKGEPSEAVARSRSMAAAAAGVSRRLEQLTAAALDMADQLIAEVDSLRAAHVFDAGDAGDVPGAPAWAGLYQSYRSSSGLLFGAKLETQAYRELAGFAEQAAAARRRWKDAAGAVLVFGSAFLRSYVEAEGY